MTLIGYTIYSKLCLLVNDYIPDTIIYNRNKHDVVLCVLYHWYTQLAKKIIIYMLKLVQFYLIPWKFYTII